MEQFVNTRSEGSRSNPPSAPLLAEPVAFTVREVSKQESQNERVSPSADERVSPSPGERPDVPDASDTRSGGSGSDADNPRG